MSSPPSRNVSSGSMKPQPSYASTNPSSFSFTYKWIFSSSQQLVNVNTMQKDAVVSMFTGIEAIITDCDGVLWIDNKAIPGAIEVIDIFKQMGKKIVFLTNNSTKTTEELLIKAKKLGFNILKKEIVSSASLVAWFLKSHGFNKKVYLIGSVGLAKELEEVGIRHLGIGPDVIQKNISQTVENFHADPDVGAVVVGFDEHFSYIKLLKATSYLNKPSCLFIATNTDERIFFNKNIVVPGTGAIVKSVETASQKEPILIGKPHFSISEALSKLYGISSMTSMLIGDSCKTDILLGTRSGFQTVLVLSGLTKFEEVAKWKESTNRDDNDLVPDYYIETIGDFLKFIQEP